MSNKFLPVEGHENLVRDTNSGAILNINNDELNKVNAIKMVKRKEKERLTNLENDVGEIKQMLNKLIEKS
jgi:hypothetical protein